ncbi:S-adenosyl-L-methionine-dependent methyltransferase [Cladorrhinum sp. PSN259]|nr:S-adenosyl-L-methionine-dependent methyltransferase [Cladorrhinum sp. PSN259]
MAEAKENWTPEVYQNNLSFVPKYASKIMEWLDPQPDDTILDLGCGDGILDVQLGQTLSQGTGHLLGIDNSQSMIAAAEKAAESFGLSEKCRFKVLDAAAELVAVTGEFSKVFSSSAMHWILASPESREPFFAGVRDALVPGGTFVFEMGGMGNISEMRAAVLSAVGRRVGLENIKEPWWFPDEEWVEGVMGKVGGLVLERAEREWRLTKADKGGVGGWVRLVGAQLFDLIDDEKEREACVREVIDVLEIVCKQPDGSYAFTYVRLRVVARKLSRCPPEQYQ